MSKRWNLFTTSFWDVGWPCIVYFCVALNGIQLPMLHVEKIPLPTIEDGEISPCLDKSLKFVNYLSSSGGLRKLLSPLCPAHHNFDHPGNFCLKLQSCLGLGTFISAARRLGRSSIKFSRSGVTPCNQNAAVLPGVCIPVSTLMPFDARNFHRSMKFRDRPLGICRIWRRCREMDPN